MITLHIEHAITDYRTWRTAFDGFAQVRSANGVRAARVGQPVDDPRWILVDLDFDTADQAAAFLQLLQSRVWSSTSASPALIGTPRAMIVEPVGAAS